MGKGLGEENLGVSYEKKATSVPGTRVSGRATREGAHRGEASTGDSESGLKSPDFILNTMGVTEIFIKEATQSTLLLRRPLRLLYLE